MGIYCSGDIFGIRIYNFNNDEMSNILFEEKHDIIMSDEQKHDVYLFFSELNDKNNIFFKIYTECTSTYELQKENFMMWYPLSLNQFLEQFGF